MNSWWKPLVAGVLAGCLVGLAWHIWMADVAMSPLEAGLRMGFSVCVLGYLVVGGIWALERLDDLEEQARAAREDVLGSRDRALHGKARRRARQGR